MTQQFGHLPEPAESEFRFLWRQFGRFSRAGFHLATIGAFWLWAWTWDWSVPSTPFAQLTFAMLGNHLAKALFALGFNVVAVWRLFDTEGANWNGWAAFGAIVAAVAIGLTAR